MQTLTDIQKATILSLKKSCEKQGFEHFGNVDDEHEVEYSQPEFVQGSDIIDVLDSLHGMEESLDVEEDSSITVLKDCMEQIKALDQRRCEFEQNLKELDEKYISVTEKTSQLHNACDKMMSEQTQLSAATERIRANLHYYKQYDWVINKLQTSKLLLTGSVFTQVLSTINDCIVYLRANSEHHEAAIYLTKYEQCMSKSLTAIKQGVLSLLEACRMDVYERQRRTTAAHMEDDPITLLYGVFGLKSASVKNTIALAHQYFANYAEYQSMFIDCEQEYFQIREQLLRSVIQATLQQLTQRHRDSTCSLAKDGCLFLLKVCDDEFRLYKQFFAVFDVDSVPATMSSSRTNLRRYTSNAAITDPQNFWDQVSAPFDQFIESLCRVLYDTLRPSVIHNHHLETLAQLCVLLKVDMIEERCLNLQSVGELEFIINPRAGFVVVMRELVGDIVERIVYRTEISTQNDLLAYYPAPGDLLYPEMFLMMKDIEAKQSKTQITSTGDSTTTVNPTKPQTSLNAIDQHGLWYPTVRRAILWLSKLYKCLDPPIFTSVSRNVWDACCQSLDIAATRIREIPIDPQKATLKTQGRLLDAELFVVKHLLIMREQSTPFRVVQPINPQHQQRNRLDSIGSNAANDNFITQFDYSLDLSKYRDNIGELFSNRSRWFELSSNNALLSFLLSPPVHINELQLDSRRIIEAELKKHCQQLIQYVIGFLTRNFTSVLSAITQTEVVTEENKPTTDYSKHPTLGPKPLNDAVSETFKSIKQNWSSIRDAYRLYIGNPETEDILLQPIRKGIVESIMTVNLFAHKHFNAEQLQVASIPSQEEVWLLINN